MATTEEFSKYLKRNSAKCLIPNDSSPITIISESHFYGRTYDISIKFFTDLISFETRLCTAKPVTEQKKLKQQDFFARKCYRFNHNEYFNNMKMYSKDNSIYIKYSIPISPIDIQTNNLILAYKFFLAFIEGSGERIIAEFEKSSYGGQF